MPSPPQRVVLITGCSSGIGRSAAEMLLSRGHCVYATARREESVAELTESLRTYGDSAIVRRLDVTLPDTSTKVIAEILETHGRIDALVNNAAFGRIAAIEELTSDELREQYEVNVFGTHDLTRRVIDPMRRADSGRIINVTSVVAHVSTPLMGAYNSSKAAVNALTESLRMELTPTGIHVVLIEPGVIKTEFRANSMRAWGDVDMFRDSRYGPIYEAWLRKWERRLKGRLTPPSAVARRIVHAIESPRPRPRYRITFAARIAPYVVALLPDRWTDRLILRSFGLK